MEDGTTEVYVVWVAAESSHLGQGGATNIMCIDLLWLPMENVEERGGILDTG